MLRRALAHRSCILLLRRAPTHKPFPPIYSALNETTFNLSSAGDPVPPSTEFIRESRRGFAKARKLSLDDDYDAGHASEDISSSVKSTTVSLMEAAIDALSRELTKLRTGRASPGMLDHIIVETGGIKMSLNHVAVVSVIDSKTLSVTPYDPNTLKELEKAIISSPLGLNPKVDGERLIAAVPPLTKEHVQAVGRIVAKSSEDVKQSVRRARQKALDAIKKATSNVAKDSKSKKKNEDSDKSGKAGPSLSKDDAKRLEKEIDELTKKFIKTAEEMCKAKEKEIARG